jgi:two-component system cell cycle response regulator
MEETMSARLALPGLVTGVLALAAGLIAFAFDAGVFAAVAGLLGLAAGVAGLRIAQHLEEQGAVQRLIAEELQSVRTEAGTADGRRGPELHQAGVDDEPGADDALTDPSTGLFSESFFEVALDSRIAAARRHLRPVAVVLLDVVHGLGDGVPAAAEASVVAEGIRLTLREADTACRLRNGHFALLLEDTPENGAIWTVERVRRRLISLQPGLTMWAGVACYPAHAFSAEEIMAAAEQALTSAREWRQDRIEVATAAKD